MSFNTLKFHPSTEGFAVSAGINLDGDIKNRGWTLKSTEPERVADKGVDYLSTGINYISGEGEIVAQRMVAEIFPGNRTELAYWTAAACPKQLSIHRGNGVLVIGNPKDGTTKDGTTNVFQLDPEVTPQVALQPGRFYSFEAVDYGKGPLIVSGYYEPPADFGNLEQYIEPGDDSIEVPGEGLIRVPEEFRIYFSKY